MEEISYEHCIYESADDRRLPYRHQSLKSMGNRVYAATFNVLIYFTTEQA